MNHVLVSPRNHHHYLDEKTGTKSVRLFYFEANGTSEAKLYTILHRYLPHPASFVGAAPKRFSLYDDRLEIPDPDVKHQFAESEFLVSAPDDPNSLVGRSVAAVSELCFVAEMALGLVHVGRELHELAIEVRPAHVSGPITSRLYRCGFAPLRQLRQTWR